METETKYQNGELAVDNGKKIIDNEQTDKEITMEGFDEVIFLNSSDESIIDEARSANVFVLKGNVLKYVSRYKFKGEPLEDLEKAQWYLNRLVKEVKDGSS